MTNYCDESDVYDATGMNSTIVQNMSSKSEAEVTTLINSYINDADRQIKHELGIPIRIVKEWHVGDGRTNQIQLGPWDEDYGMGYDPTNCVEEVFDIYNSKGAMYRRPYPRNCELGTEKNASDWGGSVTPTDESAIIKCGSYSIKASFTAADQYIQYPSAADLDKNILPWDYIGFWFRSDTDRTFTMRLYDKDGNYKVKSFTIDKVNVWKLIRLNLDEFTNGTGTIKWSTDNLWEIRIYTSGSAVIYIDNLNFNDGWWWTYPAGTVNYGIISNGQGWFAEGAKIKVTYSYDPYKVTVPDEIKKISAKLAGIALLDYLIGMRYRDTDFQFETEEMGEVITGKAGMIILRDRLEREAKAKMRAVGYGFRIG